MITGLQGYGHQTYVLIKKKDILEDLLKLSGLDYVNILTEGRGDSKSGLALGMLKRDWRVGCWKS